MHGSLSWNIHVPIGQFFVQYSVEFGAIQVTAVFGCLGQWLIIRAIERHLQAIVGLHHVVGDDLLAPADVQASASLEVDEPGGRRHHDGGRGDDSLRRVVARILPEVGILRHGIVGISEHIAHR